MKLQAFALGPFQTNCFIAIDDETNRCLIFDPGSDGKDIMKHLEKSGLTPTAVVLTHAHGDHIGGVQDIIDHYHIPFYVHEGDKDKLTDPNLNLSPHMGKQIIIEGEPTLIKEGDRISCDSLHFDVIETPGHTAGGVCFYGDGILIAGDTLFNGSIGRTDFPGGSFEELIEHIKNKLYKLPPDTVVYPGHGPETSIGYEMASNPFTR